MPCPVQLLLEVVDLAVGAQPVGLGSRSPRPARPGRARTRSGRRSRCGPAAACAARSARDRAARFSSSVGAAIGYDAVAARVERRGDAADRAALAGGVVALERGDQPPGRGRPCRAERGQAVLRSPRAGSCRPPRRGPATCRARSAPCGGRDWGSRLAPRRRAPRARRQADRAAPPGSRARRRGRGSADRRSAARPRGRAVLVSRIMVSTSARSRSPVFCCCRAAAWEFLEHVPPDTGILLRCPSAASSAPWPRRPA